MTDALNGSRPTPQAAPPAQQALRALVENGADQQALSTLATSEVLLPDPGGPEAEEEGGQQVMNLPVFEQEDGARLVPVFTSEDRMARALPEIERYHRVPLALLAGSWPSDDLALTIDVGAPEAVTLTAHGVRTLPSLGGL